MYTYILFDYHPFTTLKGEHKEAIKLENGLHYSDDCVVLMFFPLKFIFSYLASRPYAVLYFVFFHVWRMNENETHFCVAWL